MRRLEAVVAVVAVLGAVTACEDEVVMDTGSGGPAAASAEVAASASAAPAAVPPQVFSESDFGESDQSRDPFRSFAGIFAEEAKDKVRSQREVLLDQYSLDELKLVGIVTGISPAVAMLVDPTGKGHMVRRGQFVGRAEVVQSSTSAGTSYELNWRVDQVRDGDIVMIREDPANPDVPPATKVIPLRPDGDAPASG